MAGGTEAANKRPARRRRGNRPPAKTAARRQRPAQTLTRNEVVELADISLGSVNKAIEQNVIKVRRTRRAVQIPMEEVRTLLVLNSLADLRLPVRLKRSIRNQLVRVARTQGETKISLNPTLTLRWGSELKDKEAAAERYARLRDRYIELRPDVKGGAPVVRGTGLTAAAIQARLDGGDSFESLKEDYPYVDEEAFEVAAMYARAHPVRGRPARPWHKAQ